jgi:hypothetical protein
MVLRSSGSTKRFGVLLYTGDIIPPDYEADTTFIAGDGADFGSGAKNGEWTTYGRT